MLAAVTVAAPARLPVILDTDIGTDIDDAFALALVLASPELDLRGVTTVSDDAYGRVQEADDAAQPAEPPMEERILFGPESARQWSAAESTLEASTDRIRMQRPTLRWHITVNHLAGEARYPIGWPRVSCALREAATRDWSGWDFLQLWVYTDTTRAGLPQEPVGLALHTPDKEGAYNRPLAGLKKGEWVRVLVPLTEVPRHHDVRLMQLHVSESNYRHLDQLDFHLDNITLLRHAQPTLLGFAAENAVLFADATQVPVRFNLAGVKPGERVEVGCELRQGGKTVVHTAVTAARGPQRVALELGRARLEPGDFEVVARAAGGPEAATARLRLVESPWQGKEK